MKDPNTDSEGSGSLDKEEHLPDTEEATPENVPELDLGFEDQEGEFLPPQEKKKSSAGKVFLFLILVLAGSGSYLYFNNLIPVEILNLVFPKSAPSKPPALVTQTPLFMEEVVAETPEPIEVPEAVIAKPASPPENQETHVSGAPVDSMPSTHLSGTDFDQTPKESQETEKIEEPVIEQEVVTEPIAPPVAEPALPEPDEPRRGKAVQAYLNFIESSILKSGELIKAGFNWGWHYLKEKLG
jgi:hypothetical protein